MRYVDGLGGPVRASGRWAIESASGLGYLLAQQFVAAGEDVVDVPPTLSARVRVLDSTKASKSDPHDARSAAIVALRHQHLRTVAADDHAAILRMLANRHHALTRLRTQAVCRLHAQLANLTPGGLPGTLSVKRARELLATIHPDNGVTAERKHQAVELLDDVIRLDREVASGEADAWGSRSTPPARACSTSTVPARWWRRS